MEAEACLTLPSLYVQCDIFVCVPPLAFRLPLPLLLSLLSLIHMFTFSTFPFNRARIRCFSFLPSSSFSSFLFNGGHFRCFSFFPSPLPFSPRSWTHSPLLPLPAVFSIFLVLSSLLVACLLFFLLPYSPFSKLIDPFFPSSFLSSTFFLLISYLLAPSFFLLSIN